MSKFALFLIAFIAMFAMFTMADDSISEAQIHAHAAESMAFFEQLKAERTSGMNVLATPNSVAVLDYSVAISKSTMSCMLNNGFVAAIPRGYQSLGRVDPLLAANVANARAAGFKYVDTYMFPCPSKGNPEGQFNELWNHMAANKINIGMVWLDVEGTQYWGSTANNISFMQGLVSAAVKLNAKIGIYSSKVQWQAIFGSWSPGYNYPMWYAHYDSNPSCSDFSPFGGWSRPTLKQYVGDTYQCGASIDISSYC